ncbi:MAG TPA: EamA family transporter [Steroidobacteraceae bacterium]|nr:EamA family transporter [Steroidobacteraceae bacterium]
MAFVIGHAGMAFTQTGRFRAQTLGAFAVVYILWGSTYLAIAVAVQSIPPFLLIGVRSLAAGAILLGFAEFRNPGMPPARAWASAAASGVLLFGGCHGTLAYAEKYVSSGLAAIPFWIVLIKFVIPTEDRPKIMILAALVPGLAGVAQFMLPTGPQEAGPIAPEMVLILLGSAFLWALGSIVSQRQSPSIPATTSAGMQLLCGGTALLVASSLKGELTGFSPSQISPISWAGLGYLTFAGSIVAFTAYVWLLDHVRAPLVATYTFVNPIIAVGLGWALLGERLTLPMLAGFALVVASVIAVWRLEARPSGTLMPAARSS